MRLRPEVRVGLIVFLAFLALMGAWLFLGGFGLRAKTYRLYAIFTNVQTLQKGADVRMAGVKIGRVQDIKLWHDKARVAMLIDDKYKVPKGSVARISTAGVIGDYYMEIVPGASQAYVKPGTTLKSEELATLNDLMEQASGLIAGLNGLMGDLKITTTGINRIVGDKELAKSLKNTMVNLEKASAAGLRLTTDLTRTVSNASPELQRLLGQVNTAAADLTRVSRDFAAIANTTRTGLVEGGGFAKMQQILENGRVASENLVKASEGLTSLAGDQQFINNVKCTAEQARIATTQAAELATRLNKIGRRKPTQPVEKTEVPSQGLSLSAFARNADPWSRVDLNYVYRPYGEDEFYRIGLYNLGESTKLNLQVGRMLGRNSAYRYGLYASRLGIGYDRLLADRLSMHADLFWPNNPTLELKGLYRVNDNWGAWLGTDDLFGQNTLLLGAQYRK